MAEYLCRCSQGSVLETFLFLIYINDLPDGLTSMSFNFDPKKQAIEVCFTNKRDKAKYPPLQFNITDVKIADSQKHSGLI